MMHSPGLRIPFSNRKWQHLLAILILAGILAGCAGSGKFVPPPKVPSDKRPIPEPKSRSINIAGDVVKKQFLDQMKQSFDLSRQFRNLFGKKKEALNLNAFDEIDNNTWFTNRNHVKQLSVEDVARGPNRGQDGPNIDGDWTIVSVKSEGVTPGFNIKDSEGVRYVIKFEPPAYSEMPSGAEVVSTKLFYAAGYNVPENYIVFFDPKILKLGEGVKFTDRLGRKRNFNEADLAELMKSIHKLPDGRIRAAASKFLKAKGFLGPFYYKGKRKDDPNDFIRHEHHRELRGLRVISAWLNHFDTKANNSLDVFTEEGYVKHYLIDFGSTLGSNGDEPMPAYIGNENSFDPHSVGGNILTLGLNVKSWEKNWSVKYPSLGFYTSEGFHPQKYKFIQPNPAFELMTDRDGFWGAKIVMSFTDAQIEAAVKEGQYSNPEAEAYLIRTIQERRDIIGKYWFERVNPVDRFELAEDGKSLNFADLRVTSNLATQNDVAYRYSFIGYGSNALLAGNNAPKSNGNSTSIALPSGEGFSNGDQLHVLLEVRRDNNAWSKPATAYLSWDSSAGKFRLIGVTR